MTARLFLSGPMGSGKSTVGRVVAERLGRRFVDLDRAIEEREGASATAIFRERGEPAFRAIERALVEEIVRDPTESVVALGGGTVVDPGSRALLLASGAVVTLRASVDELMRRIGDDASRPLLGEVDSIARAERLAQIVDARAAAYAEAHAIVDTSGATPETVADRVLAALDDEPVLVALGAASYRAHVAEGLGSLRGLVAQVRPSSVVVVTDENAATHAARARRALGDASVVEVVLAAGEEHKTIASVEQIWDAALGARIDRDALVLAVGGGVVGDVAGLAAATLLRGVSVAHVPTTLLAMVDSAIGGKTGIDRPEGKNLVGAFHQPRFVLADLETLGTLPERELVAGLGEVVKSAWLSGEHAVAVLERDAAALRARDRAALMRAIRMSLQLKASIVARDPLERGVRAHLNLGHTVGHAIESASGYALRHGEAVGLGLVAAMHVGRALGDATQVDVDRMSAVVRAVGLRADLEPWLMEEVMARLGADKKRAGGRIRFVVPGAPGQVRIAPLTEAELRAHLMNLASRPA